MAADLGGTKQANVAINPSRNMVFFEGADLAYNYKTEQWTTVPAYNGYGIFGVDGAGASIGLVVFSSGSVHLQFQTTNYVAQTAILTTGSRDINQGGRTVVNGVRPLVNGGTSTVRVGIQDDLVDAITWSTVTSVHARSGMANFRSEGRYVRAEVTIAGGFTTAMGADVDFTEQGRV